MKKNSLRLWLQVHNAVPLIIYGLCTLALISAAKHDFTNLNTRLEAAEEVTRSDRERVILLQQKVEALYTPTPTPTPTKAPSTIRRVISPTRGATTTPGVKTP
jgi:hypothetical protein